MKPAPRECRNTNKKVHDVALRAGGVQRVWHDSAMNWHPGVSGKGGCRPTFSDQATQSCFSIKSLFSLPQRQPKGSTHNRLQSAGLD
jgi:hypothetical protein